MEKVIYNLVFNRKKRLNAEGKALIQVEAYLNRQKKYFSTKIYVKPTQWDSKRKAVRNHPNMDELNQYIEDYITYLERIELDMVQSGRPFSLKYLRERGDFESVSSSFVSFMKNEINHSVSVSAMLPLFFKQEYLALSSKKDESRNSFSPYSRSLQGTFA